MRRRAAIASLAGCVLWLSTGCAVLDRLVPRDRGASGSQVASGEGAVPADPTSAPTLLAMADEALAHGEVQQAADLYGQFVESHGGETAAGRARAIRATLVRLVAAEAEAARLRQAHEAAQRALAARESRLQQLVRELELRQAQDRELRTALDSARVELEGVRADRDRLQAEAERLRAERERLRADVERLRTIDLRDLRR